MEKYIDSNEVNFIEELYKWHDEKRRKNVATQTKILKDIWSIEFLKAQPKDTVPLIGGQSINSHKMV